MAYDTASRFASGVGLGWLIACDLADGLRIIRCCLPTPSLNKLGYCVQMELIETSELDMC